MSVPAPQLPPIDEERLFDLFSRAEELGLRFEMTEYGPVWETMPGYQHQKLALAITNSIQAAESKSDCGCFPAQDVYIYFRDQTVKRPDLAIFCTEPRDQEGFIHQVPEAVVEITSPGYEDKDLVQGPPIYLRHGVKDVVVLDRRTSEVHHWSPAGKALHGSPTAIRLTCGCQITI